MHTIEYCSENFIKYLLNDTLCFKLLGFPEIQKKKQKIGQQSSFNKAKTFKPQNTSNVSESKTDESIGKDFQVINPYEDEKHVKKEKKEKKAKKTSKVEGVAKDILKDRKKRSNTVRNPKLDEGDDELEFNEKKKKGKEDCVMF